MSEPGEGSRKIKVVDRRRFDERGELRPDRPPATEPGPSDGPSTNTAAPAPGPPQKVGDSAARPATAPPAETATRQASAGERQSATTSPLFLDLVAGLAQQAEILLLGAEGLPAQPKEAQRVIEYLAMLETKTAGNLSMEEQQVLSNVVFQLRALYLKHGS